jgi:enterochelin esterase family protein
MFRSALFALVGAALFAQRVERDLVYAEVEGRKLALDLYLPSDSGAAKPPLVIWVHGGGWRAGSRSPCPGGALVGSGFAAACISYRLSDVATFPAQIHDVKAAVRWLRANADRFGFDPNRFGAWGSSAGGHLVALLGTSGDVAELEGSVGTVGVSSKVQAVVDFFGPTDFLQMDKFPSNIVHNGPKSPESLLVGGTITEHPDRVAKANPITYVTPDDPPILIVHGDEDKLVPLNQSELLFAALQKAGVESRFEVARGEGHGFKSDNPRRMAMAFFDRAFRTAPADRVRSPEVHSDGRITFRLHAPKAGEVVVRGDWNENNGQAAATRNAAGVWSATIGPMRPDFYSYSFSVDGVRVPDPRNPSVKPASNGGPVSMVDVPGESAAYQAVRDVPHGAIHAHYYMSKAASRLRRFHVYTPPGYDAGGQRSYPVLYLLHGSGDSDAEWLSIGRAGIILDNLVAAGKAKPMLIVMPDGHPVPAMDTDPSNRGRNTQLFKADLIGDVMPMAERLYRIQADRDHRALAGLSMGGGQTLAAGLSSLDRFAHLGVFSSGVRDRADFESTHAQVLADGAKTNSMLRVFWIGCGARDAGAKAGVATLRSILDKGGIRHAYRESDGGHNWRQWRLYLSEFAPLLFQ